MADEIQRRSTFPIEWAAGTVVAIVAAGLGVLAAPEQYRLALLCGFAALVLIAAGFNALIWSRNHAEKTNHEHEFCRFLRRWCSAMLTTGVLLLIPTTVLALRATNPDAPNFHAQIVQTEPAQSPTGKDVEISMWALVQNTGTDASVDQDWQLEAKTPHGQPLHPQLEKHSGPDIFMDLQVKPNGHISEVIPTTIYPPEEQLWDSAYLNPIGKDHPGRGFLVFRIPDARSTADIDPRSIRLVFKSAGTTWFSDYYSPRGSGEAAPQAGQPFPRDMILGNLPVSKQHANLPKISAYMGPNSWIHMRSHFEEQ